MVGEITVRLSETELSKQLIQVHEPRNTCIESFMNDSPTILSSDPEYCLLTWENTAMYLISSSLNPVTITAVSFQAPEGTAWH